MKVYRVMAGVISFSLLSGCAYIAGVRADCCSKPSPAEKKLIAQTKPQTQPQPQAQPQQQQQKPQQQNIPAAEAPVDETPPSNPSTEANKMLAPLTQ